MVIYSAGIFTCHINFRRTISNLVLCLHALLCLKRKKTPRRSIKRKKRKETAHDCTPHLPLTPQSLVPNPLAREIAATGLLSFIAQLGKGDEHLPPLLPLRPLSPCLETASTAVRELGNPTTAPSPRPMAQLHLTSHLSHRWEPRLPIRGLARRPSSLPCAEPFVDLVVLPSKHRHAGVALLSLMMSYWTHAPLPQRRAILPDLVVPEPQNRWWPRAANSVLCRS